MHGYVFSVSDCGDPGTPINGNTIGSSFTFGSIINYTCNLGFLINISSQRECLDNGSWSGSLPTCESKFTKILCPALITWGFYVQLSTLEILAYQTVIL